MGVIIHEFEVVAEPQPATQLARTSQTEKEAQSVPSSHDVELILRHQLERLARVWAD